jgi:hypothetical protein
LANLERSTSASDGQQAQIAVERSYWFHYTVN